MSNRIKSGEIQMGNNFVLPIEQSKVTRSEAKVQKIMEETDAKAQSIIDGASNKSQVIVETANTEAERIIESARKKGEAEYGSVREQAYQEGFARGEQDGLEKFKNDAAEALASLDTLMSSTFDAKKSIIDSATLDIIELVSAIAEKVCHTMFDREMLRKITVDAIKQLNDKESITIIVNPQLVASISSLADDFRSEIQTLKTIKIIEDSSVSPDGVIVETLGTRVDSRISAQIEEITQRMLTGAEDELE